VQYVEEVHKHDQEIAPIPLHRMAERTATNWDPLIKLKNATQILAVSFFYYSINKNEETLCCL